MVELQNKGLQMADWCAIAALSRLNKPKKKRVGFGKLANNGYWCSYQISGSVVIDYTGYTYTGGGEGTVVKHADGSFTFTPPPELVNADVVMFGAGGGSGGGASGTEGCTGGCGYNGIAGGSTAAGAGSKSAGNIVMSASHSITIGKGGIGGAGGGKSNDDNSVNPGVVGSAGGTTSMSGMSDAGGGGGGTAGTGECGNSSACSNGSPGVSSGIGTGGPGGSSANQDGTGQPGGNGGLAAGGGGGGGGGGGNIVGDDGQPGGRGGDGGHGRITISWTESHAPASATNFC